MLALKVVTPLDVVPIVSLEDCRAHLRVTPEDDSPPSHPDDALILAQLAAAREWIEGYTDRSLTPRTYDLALDHFPSNEILLPKPPATGIVSVVYFDTDGVQQTLAPSNYVLDSYQEPGWLLPASGFSWPSTYDTINAVTVRYTAGYTLWDNPVQAVPMPKMMRAAVLLLLGDLYENRENTTTVRMEEIPYGVKSLCDWHRIRKGMA